jgi:hypothetical protein
MYRNGAAVSSPVPVILKFPLDKLTLWFDAVIWAYLKGGAMKISITCKF